VGALDQVRTRQARQAQVADDGVHGVEIVLLRGLLHRRGLAHHMAVAFQQAAQGGADDVFVFDNEDVAHGSVLTNLFRRAQGECYLDALPDQASKPSLTI